MKLIKRFADLGFTYRAAYLSHYSPARLRQDPQYGLCAFLFSWAFERARAPRGYRIAAVKAMRLATRSDRAPKDVASLFSEIYSGKANRRINPAFDPALSALDVPSIIVALEDGHMERAFSMLTIRGLGHKLKAFFLRDIVSILQCEDRALRSSRDYLWCQPVDFWVRLTAEILPSSDRHDPIPSAGRYGLGRVDLDAAWKVVCLSREAGVSPLAVNQGIWYFYSNAVADEGRLRALLSSDDPKRLDAELALMEGFLPVRPSWGELNGAIQQAHASGGGRRADTDGQ